jgi:hypothetical protein
MMFCFVYRGNTCLIALTVTFRGSIHIRRVVFYKKARYDAVHAPVAQLDRVSGFEPGGREFESLRARCDAFLE